MRTSTGTTSTTKTVPGYRCDPGQLGAHAVPFRSMFLIFWLFLICVPMVIRPKQTAQNMRRSVSMYRRMRPRHLAWALLSVASAVTAAYLLYKIPLLRHGWLVDLSGWMSGGSSGETPAKTSMWSTLLYVIPLFAMMILMASVIPVLAENEENSFRRRIIWASRSRVLSSSVMFGLVHLVMGIPVSAALALSFSGLVFAVVARRAARTEYARIKGRPENLSPDRHPSMYSLYLTCTDHPELFDDDTRTSIDELFDIGLRDDADDTGVAESTLVHAVHNVIIVSTLLVTLSLFYFA